MDTGAPPAGSFGHGATRIADHNSDLRFVVDTVAKGTDDPQWALKLCDGLIAAATYLAAARDLRAACLHIRTDYLACARALDPAAPGRSQPMLSPD